MEKIFNLVLILHIVGGTIGLLTGTLNIARSKGDKIHRQAGKLFVWAMLTVGFSALVLSAIHPSYFLFMVGIFTLYMIGTGNRYLFFKQANKLPSMVDWIITITMALFGFLFVALGIWFLLKSDFFGLVFLTFGSFGLLFVRTDITNYQGKSKAKNYWLLAHLQRMTGGYIAALTAFLVVNAKHSPVQIPPALFWLFPTIILVPLIIRWSRKYKVQIKEHHI